MIDSNLTSLLDFPSLAEDEPRRNETIFESFLIDHSPNRTIHHSNSSTFSHQNPPFSWHLFQNFLPVIVVASVLWLLVYCALIGQRILGENKYLVINGRFDCTKKQGSDEKASFAYV